MQQAAIILFGIFFITSIILIFLMHYVKEKGATLSYGLISGSLNFIFAAMFFANYAEIAFPGVGGGVDFNKFIAILHIMIGFYSIWYSSNIFITDKKEKKNNARDNAEFSPV